MPISIVWTATNVHIAQKVTEWIEVYLVRISGDELCSLLNAMKKIKTIEFNSLTILSDSECNFKEMKDCQIDFLSFKYLGVKEHSNLENNIKIYHHMLLGIEKCFNLISSLNTLFSNIHFLRNKDNDLIQKSIENIQNFRKLTLMHTPLHTSKLNIIHVIP